MDSMLTLSRAFAQQYAQEAVDTLDELTSAEAGALIAELPAESAAELLGHIPAARAAECLADMPAAKAAAIIRNLAPNPAAHILRPMPAATREKLLVTLTRWRRVQIELVLRQSRQTVGAWMDTRVATARPASTAGGTLRRLPRDNVHGWLFVTGIRRQLVGAVPIAVLAQSAPETRVENLLQPTPPPLRTSVTVGAALTHAGWNDHDILPVVEGNDRLVGMLSHATLRQASSISGRTAIVIEHSGTIMDMANVIYLGMAEVMNATIARNPKDNMGIGKATRRE